MFWPKPGPSIIARMEHSASFLKDEKHFCPLVVSMLSWWPLSRKALRAIRLERRWGDFGGRDVQSRPCGPCWAHGRRPGGTALGFGAPGNQPVQSLFVRANFFCFRTCPEGGPGVGGWVRNETRSRFLPDPQGTCLDASKATCGSLFFVARCSFQKACLPFPVRVPFPAAQAWTCRSEEEKQEVRRRVEMKFHQHLGRRSLMLLVRGSWLLLAALYHPHGAKLMTHSSRYPSCLAFCKRWS